MHGRIRRVLGAVLVLALLSSCGARLDAEQKAALAAGGGDALSAAADDGVAHTGDTAASTDGTATDLGATTITTAPRGDAAADDSSTAEACTPQPVDEIGVTDAEIVLGNVSMLSGPIPGAGQPGIDGTRAYLEYVNSQGGVCGRRLRLVTGDDRTDPGQNRSEAQRLMRQAFGLVGGVSIVDAGTGQAVEGTDVPVVQVAVADNALASRNIFSPSPLDPTGEDGGSVPHWRYFNRTVGLHRVGIVVVSLASARARAAVYVKDITNAGLEVSGVHEVGLAETNYVAVAQQLVNEGADGFIALLDPVGASRLAKAAQQIGWHPRVAHYGAQNYGRSFLDLAGDAAEGALVPLAFDIFEDDSNPTVALFNEWYARVAPGRPKDFYSAMGWASADMMVEALRASGPAPTRTAVLEHLRGLTSFDAHGFLATCNPAGKVTSPYFMVATVEGGQWKRSFPASGFSDGT